MYLVYETEEEAIARADQEGKDNELSYWMNGIGTRWITGPEPTADDKWSLDVSKYVLDASEQAATIDAVSPAPVEEEDFSDAIEVEEVEE